MLTEFLHRLLSEGEVVLRERPVPSRDSRRAIELLAKVYADYRLEVAGPLIDFHPATALAAGELVCQACWFLVNHQEPERELERALVMPGPPAAASHHLSADLVLRFLPQIHRRARALDQGEC